MSKAAELRAEDCVGTGNGRSEVYVDVLARNGILLDAQCRDREAVDHVLRVQVQVDLAVERQDEFGGDEVVCATGVGGVDAEGIALAGRDQLGAGAAEGVVGAGIAEGPGELHAGGLDLQCREIGADVARSSPQALGSQGEEGEEQGEGGEWEVLNERLIAGFGAAAERQPGEEDHVGQCEQRGGDPEV